jgi:hypothetical protein
MVSTDEDRTLTICQTTGHAVLVPWGRFSRYLKLSERLWGDPEELPGGIEVEL